MVDVMTMETQQIDVALYYQYPFKGIMSRKQLTEFIVIGIESPEFDPNETRTAKREKLRCVQVELVRVSDLGKNNNSYLVHTHLGEKLNYNDSVLCYDIEQANLPEDIRDGMSNMRKDAPDVVVVKKHYPRYRKKARQRYWKLERMPMKNEENIDYDENKPDDNEKLTTKKAKKAKNNRNLKKRKIEKDYQDDFEQFLRDLEDDPDMRSTINMYKDKKAIDDLEAKLNTMTLGEKASELGNLNKLIKQKKKMQVKRKTEKGKQLQEEKKQNEIKTQMILKAIKEDDESDLEDDFPVVQLNELMDNLNIEDKDEHKDDQSDDDDNDDDEVEKHLDEDIDNDEDDNEDDENNEDE